MSADSSNATPPSARSPSDAFARPGSPSNAPPPQLASGKIDYAACMNRFQDGAETRSESDYPATGSCGPCPRDSRPRLGACLASAQRSVRLPGIFASAKQGNPTLPPGLTRSAGNRPVRINVPGFGSAFPNGLAHRPMGALRGGPSKSGKRRGKRRRSTTRRTARSTGGQRDSVACPKSPALPPVVVTPFAGLAAAPFAPWRRSRPCNRKVPEAVPRLEIHT